MNNKIVCFFSASGNTNELAYKINEIVNQKDGENVGR